MKTTIHFIRHGSVINPEDILYGRLPDFSLSPRGVAEAERTAVGLQDSSLAAIYTSPMLRALQTAEAIHVFHPDVPVIQSDELNEVNTPYQGMKAEKLRHLNEDFYTGTQPPYEQPADVLSRVERFIWSLRGSDNKREVVAVTHGDVVSFCILKVKKFDVVPGNKALLVKTGIRDNYPAPASVTTLTYYTDFQDEIPDVGYRTF